MSGSGRSLALLRELHAPVGDEWSLRCEGCDMEGMEAEMPRWPCRTAEIIYSEVEITEVTGTYESWHKWVKGAENRKRMASGWGFGDDMNQAMIRQIRRSHEMWDRIGQLQAEGKTVTFEIVR